jgi:hypothetical protein
MTKKSYNLILQAIKERRGDNLERAKAAFRNCTPDEMKRQYGQSGNTRQEVIDGYQRHVDEVNAALKDFEQLLNVPNLVARY